MAVVGAGLAGLTAARELVARGYAAVVVDERDRIGGRLATVRLGDAVFDYGAQFFTIRGEAFQALTDEAVGAGAAREWCRGFEQVDGYPRYCGTHGMADFAAWLAHGLDVRLGVHVTALSAVPADAYVVTAPISEALALLRSSRALPAPDEADRLAHTTYNATIAFLCSLDRSPALPHPGALQQPDSEVFSFIADNQAKGISPMPALTFHVANPASRRLWGLADAALTAELLDHARPWLGGAVPVATKIVRWRHAGPTTPLPEPCVVVRTAPQPVVLAGDAYDGPKVEGAFRSGQAAARRVDELLSG